MAFKIQIEQEAHLDIQEAITWYNQQSQGLGQKFHAQVKEHFESLKANPFFQVRYKKIHCLPVRKYPYMIHFTVDEETEIVTIRAVFHTSRNPKIWIDRK